MAVELVTLRAGELEAAFAPSAGMVCASLRHRGEELLGQRQGLDAYVERGATMGVPLLYPWANRVGVTRFELLGRTVDLDRAPDRWRRDGETGLPIHGLLAAAPGWEVTGQGPTWLCATFDWSAHDDLMAAFPFAHRVTLEADLGEDGLELVTEVEPEGADPVPVAFGFHPYLQLPGEPRAGWRVELPVRRRLVLDERKLPSGRTEDVEPWSGELGERTFDDGFDRLAGDPPGFVLAGRERTITVTMDWGYPCAQVFAPDSDDVVAFEPMTAPTNALVTGAELPRAPRRAAFTIHVR